jgi:Tfp pilus assembly protein PilF
MEHELMENTSTQPLSHAQRRLPVLAWITAFPWRTYTVLYIRSKGFGRYCKSSSQRAELSQAYVTCGKQVSACRLLLLTAALMGVGCSTDPAARKQKYFDSGTEYYNSGKLSEAAIQFRNALRVDPKFAEAGTVLAKLQLRRGEFADAYKLLLNAVAAKPDYLPAHLMLGSLYLAGNRLEEAQ